MKRKLNTLFFKVISTVILGFCCLTMALIIINIKQTEKVYIENFVDSQEKIFRQIDTDIYDFFMDVAEIHAGVAASVTVQDYLTTDAWDSVVEERQNLLNLDEVLNSLPLADYPELNLILVGTNGKIYTQSSSSLFLVSGEEILAETLVARIIEKPRQILCMYRDSGYVNWMADSPVIIIGRAITDRVSGEVIGVALLSMKEAEFAGKYSYFTMGTGDIVVFNQDDEIISSNNDSYLQSESMAKEAFDVLTRMREQDRKELEVESGGHLRQYMMQQLQSTNYVMLGIIDPQQAFTNVYDVRAIIGVMVVITIGIISIIFSVILQYTRPLDALAERMQYVREGDLEHFAEVKGTTEVRELAQTYNQMIVDLDHYIHQIVEAEKSKREAEIHSLQMQINPHYIYNTLASIKWLIWQGEKEKSVNVIDSFIRLLRNTISNKQDRITLSQEIDNLKDYVYINQVRYGTQVNVEYYVMPQCETCMVPKLILQPFVENAFFHAFPEGRTGSISVFARMTQQLLEIEIVDDGVGIEYDKLKELLKKETPKQEHFTGIGINNVDDRLKLIYGSDYGIHIKSETGSGTTILLRFPVVETGQ